MHKLTFSIGLLLVLLAATLAPAAGAPPQQDPVKVRIGLLPVLDTLPFYVASKAGYFADAGLDVELIPVSGPLELYQLVLAGGADMVLTDVTTVIIFNQDEPQVQIVAQARRAYPGAPLFRVLAAPDSGLSSAEDLTGVEIAISENTVIQYITRRILENEGLTIDDLAFRPEPNILVRYQLLLEGAIQAATLPDPLAQAAIEDGAILIADDSALAEEQYSQSVLVFRTGFVADQPEAVDAFVAAWMQAAADINADPELYRSLWLENTTVPASVQDTYELPPFPTEAVTSESVWRDNVDWLLEIGTIEDDVSYADSVNTSFVEGPVMVTADGPGDPTNGEALFAAHCASCHAVTDTAGAGPGMAGVTERAAEYGLDMSARDYLVESIVEPGAYLVEGYANIMPSYAETLTADEIDDLVAYLLTLE